MEKWELTRKTKADLPTTMEHFMHPENLPKVNPENIRRVTIKDRKDNTITYDIDFRVMGRNLHTFTRHTIDKNAKTVTAEAIDGDSKGSTIVTSLKELPNNSGTEMKYSFSLELGALGFLTKGAAKSFWEKTADGDVRYLDSRAK